MFVTDVFKVCICEGFAPFFCPGSFINYISLGVGWTMQDF